MRLPLLALIALGLPFFCIESAAQERGIFSARGSIVRIRDTSIELESGSRFNKVTTIYDLADDVRFEEVEFKVVEGKLKTSRKTITRKDLFETQQIDVIGIRAGFRQTILVGVVPGANSAGVEGLKLITKLGGKVEEKPWTGDEMHYHVDLSGTRVADDDIAILATIEKLGFLNLRKTSITNEGIAHLKDHRKLSDLILTETKITDDVFPLLESLSLHHISVDGTAVTRRGIVEFANTRSQMTFCFVSAGPERELRVNENIRETNFEKAHKYLTKRSIYYGQFFMIDSGRRKATTYYHRDGPVGTVLSRFDYFSGTPARVDPSEVRLPATLVACAAAADGGLPMAALHSLWSEPALAVVELNTGTIAAYGRPFQTIDFYNDTPELVSLNRTTNGQKPPFGFIEDAIGRGCNVRIVDGAYKKTLRQEAPQGFYSAIFLEITVRQREDAKAVTKQDVYFDLMTQEGIRDLMDRTAPGGVLCYHTSHRSHEFYKSLSAAASALGYACKRGKDMYPGLLADGETWRKADQSHFSSEWIMIARKQADLSDLRFSRRNPSLSWDVPEPEDMPAWRDGAEPVMPIRKR